MFLFGATPFISVLIIKRKPLLRVAQHFSDLMSVIVPFSFPSV